MYFGMELPFGCVLMRFLTTFFCSSVLYMALFKLDDIEPGPYTLVLRVVLMILIAASWMQSVDTLYSHIYHQYVSKD